MSVELAELEPVLKESAESTATLMEQVMHFTHLVQSTTSQPLLPRVVQRASSYCFDVAEVGIFAVAVVGVIAVGLIAVVGAVAVGIGSVVGAVAVGIGSVVGAVAVGIVAVQL
jgi:hypothetical protein